MSLQHYQKLSSLGADSLGMALPTLTAATLDLQTQRVDLATAKEQVANFDPQQGWVQGRDYCSMQPQLPEDHFLEAEFCRDNDSLKVRYLGADSYLLQRMAPGSQSDQSQVFTEQSFVVRGDKTQPGCRQVLYRLWWRMATDGVDEGRWQPWVQQFVGFADKEVK